MTNGHVYFRFSSVSPQKKKFWGPWSKADKSVVKQARPLNRKSCQITGVRMLSSILRSKYSAQEKKKCKYLDDAPCLHYPQPAVVMNGMSLHLILVWRRVKLSAHHLRYQIKPKTFDWSDKQDIRTDIALHYTSTWYIPTVTLQQWHEIHPTQTSCKGPHKL